jgi:hypothetical protein
MRALLVNLHNSCWRLTNESTIRLSKTRQLTCWLAGGASFCINVAAAQGMPPEQPILSAETRLVAVLGTVQMCGHRA